MPKEQITDKEAIYLVIVFIMGSSLIIGIGGDAKNDAWLAGICAAIISIPMLLLFSRILSLFQGKDLFEILDLALGKVIGKFVSILYIWYAFHLGALVLRNFGEFINIVAMPETPIIVPLLFMGLVCIFATKLGIEVMGRINTFFFPILIFILILVQLLMIPLLKLHYIKPILGNGLAPLLKGTFAAFSFPFAEVVVFIAIFSALKTKKSHFKVYFLGVLIATIIIIITTLRNISILGLMLGSFYFPSYAAVSKIRIGSFLERIEVTVAIIFVFGVFIKSSVCLLVVCKGIKKTFKLNDYRSIVIQTGLLMVYFSYIVYDNSMEMQYWAFKVYPYYAFPFQVVLPIIIWIFSEIKSKKLASQTNGLECSDQKNQKNTEK